MTSIEMKGLLTGNLFVIALAVLIASPLSPDWKFLITGAVSFLIAGLVLIAAIGIGRGQKRSSLPTKGDLC